MIDLSNSRANHVVPNPKLSVVIPAWNEEKHISRTLEEIANRLANLSKEIIVVDDGSRDDTAKVVQDWQDAHQYVLVNLIKNTGNNGKGHAIRQGISQSVGDYVSFIDADLDVPPQAIAPFYDEIRKRDADIIVAKKNNLWGTPGISLYRKILSVSFRTIVKYLFKLPISDTQTGLKIFRGSWIRRIIPHIHTDGFLFDLEILVLAQKDGAQMTEKPITLTPSVKQNRISLRHIVQSITELLIIYIRYHNPRTGHRIAKYRTKI